MSIEKKSLKRTFVLNSKELPDPGSHLSPKEVKDLYESKYPELMSAAIVKSVQEDAIKYEFKTKIPTNG